MGVINMAHGELIMIGAYATYVVQNLFRSHLPGAFDCVPRRGGAGRVRCVGASSAWCWSARVIRFLYGRPLETLLATWGISLILIQAMRTIFGAQNVQVENPAWMSGGIELMSNVVLPYSRIVIIGFAGGGAAAGVAAADAHAARALRARRHAEPRDGERARRADRPQSTCWRSGWARASPGSPAARCRRSATSGRTSARATSSTRSWSSCWAASGSSPAPSTRRSGLGIVNKFLEAWSGRGAGQDRGAGVHHRLHPEASAGPVRAQGPDGRWLRPR